jgi:putative tryptophan/tyrosine transport system substrate-binding protein
MKRRDFIVALGGAAAASSLDPLAARAQQRGKVWRIGFLAGQRRQDDFSQYDGFVQGMRELGYVEGKDYVSDIRFAEGQYERLPDLAADLVRLKPDILFSGLSPAVRALQQATHTIPIVFVGVTDPVGQGLVASLARPGGNLTGSAGSFDDTSPKRLELLTAVSPVAKRIGLLFNPGNVLNAASVKSAQAAAEKAGLSLISIEARDSQGLESAFARFGKEGAQAVMVEGDAVFRAQRRRVAELALAGHLPSIAPQLEYVEAGGLLGYGDKIANFFRQGASYVDKILKGAKPADLPVEEPVRFRLVINLKTAKALALAVPPSLLAIADEVIE